MKSLMIQGSGSDAGKSLFCAGLIRAFKRKGVVALPFKPQNMSNNAAVTEGGDVTGEIAKGEIGRAQALQAQAAGVPPAVDMNPILLKPQAGSESQIIVQGQLWGQAMGGDYYKLKPQLMPYVEQSFRKIASLADIVIVEGAGSPAEINLRDGDIANMGFATHFGVPVVLLGDIERGGVIANLVGTYHLLPQEERDLIKAFVINKFRGDTSLFDSAIDVIGDRTGWQFGGIIPWLDSLANLPQEDALGLRVIKSQQAGKSGGGLGVGVLQLPHIANFDDLDALRAEASVHLQIIEAGQPIPADVRVLIIPGSKAIIADTRYVFAQGWDTEIKAFALRGGIIVGLCGGYQMLGHTIEDRYGLEGDKEVIEGLGLLDMATVLQGDKHLSKTTAQETLFGGEVGGYEIHLGISEGSADVFMRADDGTAIGHISGDKKIMGCYLHGLFANDEFRRRFLSQLGDHVPSYDSYDGLVEDILDEWAEHLERHCDLDLLESLAAEIE